MRQGQEAGAGGRGRRQGQEAGACWPRGRGAPAFMQHAAFMHAPMSAPPIPGPPTMSAPPMRHRNCRHASQAASGRSSQGPRRATCRAHMELIEAGYFCTFSCALQHRGPLSCVLTASKADPLHSECQSPHPAQPHVIQHATVASRSLCGRACVRA